MPPAGTTPTDATSASDGLNRRGAGLLDAIGDFCRLKTMAESTFVKIMNSRETRAS